MCLLRDSLRAKAEQMLAEEADALCGESLRPEAGAQYRRAGSDGGPCDADGCREPILLPRVRKQVGNGTERAHLLGSYAAMRQPGNNAAAVVTALGAGMSMRGQALAHQGVMSKTAALCAGLREGEIALFDKAYLHFSPLGDLNSLEWSPGTVCDLYRCRWATEVFFKQLKQTVQLVDFLGNSASAVQWQVRAALLVHLRLRFLA